jgi:hypothetical protein
MGQSTSGSGSARNQSVAEEFRSLQDLLGDWIVDEFVFRAPNAEPIVNTGRTTCRTATGRLAIVVITDITTSLEQTITLNTFDPRQNRYELALVDSSSDTGIVLMIGQTLNTRSTEDIRVQFGKAATAVREWTLASGQSGAQTGIDVERIVENKISDDRWVLQFFGRTQHGEVLIKQQVLTRAQPGCQPQVGCELGCPGLMGCQEGCQGVQGLQGLQGQAQLACSCQSLTGQAQLVTQPPMLTQPVLLAQPGMIAQPSLVQPLAAQLPVIGLAQPVLVAQPTCVRAPVRPPVARTEHPHK